MHLSLSAAKGQRGQPVTIGWQTTLGGGNLFITDGVSCKDITGGVDPATGQPNVTWKLNGKKGKKQYYHCWQPGCSSDCGDPTHGHDSQRVFLGRYLIDEAYAAVDILPDAAPGA